MTLVMYFTEVSFLHDMSRASREQSAKHREQILREAARAFRERGFDNVSVADLMARAGLTHGGFYGHFASKQALEAQACARASEKTARWDSIVDKQPESAKALREIIEIYLSVAHRDNVGSGCSTAALATDVARAQDARDVRAAYVAGVHRLADILATLVPNTRKARRKEALATLATLTGAITLARATKGSPLSREILASACNSLQARK
jgi:TetR/AcrR family transcriptional regulator, transcriptional repressor for nem operon